MKNLSNIKLATQLFIDGQFVNAKSGKTFDVINPSNEKKITSVQEASKEDVDLAIKAARTAFHDGPWSKMTPDARIACMLKLADLVEKNAEELAAVESWNNGKPFYISKIADVPLTWKCYRYYAGWIDKIRGSTFPINGPYFGYTLREPVGVVGQIIPWNFPLLMQAWKLGPALAAGCTVVMKTAEQTPLSALKVAELIQQAGFPKGVVNILSGHGDAGEYLSQHKGIDKVAFTGSTEVGYKIMRGAHKENLKRITLELGGKSPNIITANADLDKAVTQSCMGLFFNAGQCCIAGSRTYVHASVYDEYVKRVAAHVKEITCGDPFSDSTRQGPLVSKEQFDRVMNYIEIGKKEGARVVAGGKRSGNVGYFVEPTVFADVTHNMTISKEEIFGPVMSIFKFNSNDEVLHYANDTEYGLGAGVVTENAEEAIWFSKKLRAGTVYVNCYNVFDSTTPFGGFKDSGIGRELGEEALSNYLETKTVINKWTP